MDKPTIFFSHSSSDKDVMLKLKELFCEKTGGTIEVFLSSDGQSIPLGKNWVYRVQEALDEAKIMIVFLTPASIRSSWIYFEAGYAYSKILRVVPVGLLGADISSVAPPLSLLQGFNIESKDGLDNLIALVNDIFSHNHKATFTEVEYRSITIKDDKFSFHPLGELLGLVNEIHIEISESDNLCCTPEKGIRIAIDFFEKRGLEYRVNKNCIESFGLTAYTTDSQRPRPIIFTFDPALSDSTVPLAIEIVKSLRAEGVKGISIRFDFVDTVECVKESHKLSARLFGTGVTLGEDRSFVYEGLMFSVDHLIHFVGDRSIKRGATYLSMTPVNNTFSLGEAAKLMRMLITNKVLYESEQWTEV